MRELNNLFGETIQFGKGFDDWLLDCNGFGKCGHFGVSTDGGGGISKLFLHLLKISEIFSAVFTNCIKHFNHTIQHATLLVHDFLESGERLLCLKNLSVLFVNLKGEIQDVLDLLSSVGILLNGGFVSQVFVGLLNLGVQSFSLHSLIVDQLGALINHNAMGSLVLIVVA